MLFSTLATIFLSATTLSATSTPELSSSSSPVLARGPHARRFQHHQVARSLSSNATTLKKRGAAGSRRSAKKSSTCKAGSGSSNSTSTSTDDGSSDDSDSSSSSSSSSNSTSSASQGSGASQAGGVVHVTDPTCGPNNPSPKVSTGGGPNGEQSWFNCGLSSGGWTPPMLKVSDLIYMDLTTALEDSNSVFAPCKQYLSYFNKYAASSGYPAIMLASFAMQESTCNQNVKNSAGTEGLFQVAPQNCKAYAGSSEGCNGDIDLNFQAAIGLLKDLFKQYDDNAVAVMGNYNGWYNKMTPGEVLSHPCNQQQNLNYLQQVLNGYLNGEDGDNLGTNDQQKGCGFGSSRRKRSLYVPRYARRAEDQHELGWHF